MNFPTYYIRNSEGSRTNLCRNLPHSDPRIGKPNSPPPLQLPPPPSILSQNRQATPESLEEEEKREKRTAPSLTQQSGVFGAFSSPFAPALKGASEARAATQTRTAWWAELLDLSSLSDWGLGFKWEERRRGGGVTLLLSLRECTSAFYCIVLRSI